MFHKFIVERKPHSKKIEGGTQMLCSGDLCTMFCGTLCVGGCGAGCYATVCIGFAPAAFYSSSTAAASASAAGTSYVQG